MLTERYIPVVVGDAVGVAVGDAVGDAVGARVGQSCPKKVPAQGMWTFPEQKITPRSTVTGIVPHNPALSVNVLQTHAEHRVRYQSGYFDRPNGPIYYIAKTIITTIPISTNIKALHALTTNFKIKWRS